MSGYEKFLFDNFVIEEEGEQKQVPEELDIPTSETAVIIPEGADKSIEEDKTEEISKHPDDEQNTESEQEQTPSNPEDILVQPDPEDNLPEVITYTEDEVADKVEEARKEGYAQGLAAATNSSEAQIQNLLQEIDKALQKKFAEEDDSYKAMREGFRELGLTLLQKFIINLEQEQAEELLNKFLEDNFANFIKEPKLTFYFNPEIIKKGQDIVARLAHKGDYEGKIVLQKDSSLGLSDCRVEWALGGAERNSEKMKEQAQALLSEL